MILTKTQEQDLYYRKKRVKRYRNFIAGQELRIERLEATLEINYKNLVSLRARLAIEETRLDKLRTKLGL